MPTDLTLSGIVFAPLVGALIVLSMPVRNDLQRFRVRTAALFATVVPLLLALFDMLAEVPSSSQGSIPAPAIDAPWLRGFFFQLDYHFGTDGLNLLLLVAVTVIFPALVLASWRHRERYRTYFALLLLAEVGLTGALATQDLGMFIIFFGLPILPLALLIGLGATPRSRSAARRLLATQSLSLAALIAGTLLLLLRTGNGTLNFSTLTTVKAASGSTGLIVETLFLAAFLMRMGAFPFHRWLVDGLTEASTPLGMLLAVSSLPLGAYGLIRIAVAMEPNGALQLTVPLLVLALITLFWGALSARGAQELRRIAANSLVAVGGLVILGVATFSETSLSGAIYLIFAFIFAAPLLLLAVGAICDRSLLHKIQPLAGAAASSPRLRLFFMLAAASLTGIPLLVGFPAIFEIVVSGIATQPYVTAFAVLGLLVLTAAWWRVAHRVFTANPDNAEVVTVSDSHGSEFYAGWVLAAAAIMFGIFAGFFIPYTVQGTSLVAARVSAVAPVVHPKAK
ncbi:MAG TPA: proton-conducting transporter membrane subunit [Candidatus Nanopelagicaceae bacterium]|nr:proton-conducting transporter membrane subunit [Candidatus Nanopelagicaceae bacterium]